MDQYKFFKGISMCGAFNVYQRKGMLEDQIKHLQLEAALFEQSHSQIVAFNVQGNNGTIAVHINPFLKGEVRFCKIKVGYSGNDGMYIHKDYCTEEFLKEVQEFTKSGLKVTPRMNPTESQVRYSQFKYFPGLYWETDYSWRYSSDQNPIERMEKEISSSPDIQAFMIDTKQNLIRMVAGSLKPISQLSVHKPQGTNCTGIYIHIDRYNKIHNDKIYNESPIAVEITSPDSIVIETANLKQFKFFPTIYSGSDYTRKYSRDQCPIEIMEKEALNRPNLQAFMIDSKNNMLRIIEQPISSLSLNEPSGTNCSGIYIHVDRYNKTHTNKICIEDSTNEILNMLESSTHETCKICDKSSIETAKTYDPSILESDEDNLNDLVKQFYQAVKEYQSNELKWFVIIKDNMDKLALFDGLNEIKCWYIDQIELVFSTDIQVKFSSSDELCSFIKYQINHLK